MFKPTTLAAVLLAFLSEGLAAAEVPIWEGGLWNLPTGLDTSRNGHFRVFVELDVEFTGYRILKIEWVESLESVERVYGTLFVDESVGIVNVDPITAQEGIVPSFVLIYAGGLQVLCLRIWEPGRYETPDECTL